MTFLKRRLIEICDHCGKPNALRLPDWHGNGHCYCSDCLPQIAMQATAESHLHNLLSPILQAWRQQWHPHLTEQQLREISTNVLQDINTETTT